MPRILVVDDSAEWRDYLGKSLEASGYEVRFSASGEEALAELEAQPPDLLVLDLSLAGASGYDLLERMRLEEELAEIPVLLLASREELRDKYTGIELGANDFLIKGSSEELIPRVRALLRSKSLQDQVRKVNRRFQEEYELARRVQQSLLPFPLPKRRGLRVAARYEPSLFLGGDFFDVTELEGDSSGLFIADVVGHGVSAALFTGFLKAQLLHWAIGWQRNNPAETLTDMNVSLCRAFHGSGLFVTAAYATYEPGIERLHYANAGHPEPILLDAAGAVSTLPGAEIPLGIEPAVHYQTRSVPFAPGDRVLFFTDGVIEARQGEQGPLFGRRRLNEVLTSHRTATLDATLDAILDAVAAWHGSRRYSDDINLLAVECLPVGETA